MDNGIEKPERRKSLKDFTDEQINSLKELFVFCSKRPWHIIIQNKVVFFRPKQKITINSNLGGVIATVDNLENAKFIADGMNTTEKLIKRVEVLTEALEYYAHYETYVSNALSAPILSDLGKKAREVLE